LKQRAASQAFAHCLQNQQAFGLALGGVEVNGYRPLKIASPHFIERLHQLSSGIPAGARFAGARFGATPQPLHFPAYAVRQGLLPAALSHQLQDLDGGVIVVQHVALRRLPDQLVEGRRQVRGDCLHHIPLGRGRQRNLQMPLQAFEAVER